MMSGQSYSDYYDNWWLPDDWETQIINGCDIDLEQVLECCMYPCSYSYIHTSHHCLLSVYQDA